ncbi:M48 family metallopeptidase [Patescibacteria group bacterium]|nr:M48 family metallopeptidase [Patescibacteria group bacterium]MCH8889240.1 M48 family metallopeptidase [Patescibacteria group bacterium]
MATIYTHSDANIRKTWFLMTAFLIVVILIGYAFSWYFESSVILYVAVAFAVLMNVFSYWYSDKIVIKMTKARPISRESHREVWNLVENLSITAGLPMPSLYIVDDPAPNAFATGRNPEHAVVAVTTGILALLDRTELEGVLAHELSHIGNRDMLVSTVAVVLVGFVAILADIFLRMTFFGRGGGNSRDGRLQLIFLVVGIFAAILAPIAARLIHLAISRKREFLADASGALLTRYPEGLASALIKISEFGKPMKVTSHATAHLFIANPFGAEEKGFKSKMNKLFSTHPDVSERVAALRGT